MAEHITLQSGLLTSPRDLAEDRSAGHRRRSGQVRVGRRTALLIPLGLFAIVLGFGLIMPSDVATDQSLTDRLIPPMIAGGSWEHPLGTDGLGRDLLARISTGALTSLQIGLIASAISAFIGIGSGIASGLLGGWTDRFLTLLSEISLTVPSVVVGVVLTATLGQSLRNLIVILVLSGWISYARVLRLQTLQITTSEYVLSAAALGAGKLHIALRHLLPNLLPTMLVLLFQQIGGMMLWEASLTYLGLGARPNMVTLGSIVRDGQDQIFNGWWVSVFSGLTVAIAIVGFAFLGDWLRERFDRTFGIPSATE